MRLPLFILATLLAVAAHADPGRYAAEAAADSLYDAGAVDSLFAFSDRMIARARADRDSVLLGRMMYHRGRARLALREPGAGSDFDGALAIATALGDSTGRMHALGLKAFVAVNQGRFEESITINEERIALARALRRRGSEAWGHLLIGYAELYRENYARSIAEYEEAWRAFRDAGRPRDQLSASIGLARALERTGRHDEARTSYQRAWLAARELGDRGQEADAINNLGGIEMEHGDLALAAEYFDRAYHIKRDLKSFDIANTARNVALVDQVIGRYAHAESTLVEAMSMSTQGMLDISMAVELGRLRMSRGRFAGAIRCFREVLSQRAGLPRKTLVEAATFLATSLAAVDSVEAAIAILQRELPAPEAVPASIWRAEALLAWSQCLRERHDPTRAGELARMAFDDATAREDSFLIVSAASEMSLCARARGDSAAALEWFQRARDTFETSRPPGEFQWREARRAELARSLRQSGDMLRIHPAGVPAGERNRRHFDFLQQVQSRTLLERVSDPRRFHAGAPGDPVTSRAVQREVLRPGECLFALIAGADCVYAFSITPDELRTRVIEDREGTFTKRLHNFARLSSKPSAGDALDGASRSLGEVVFGELAGLVRASATVYAVLDGSLAGIPFETLVCPGESEALIVAHTVVRIPSAALLRHLREHPVSARERPSLLAVASDIPALEGARDEVDYLASRYGARRAVDPDRADLLARLPGYDAVHVASHVHIDGERPWHSGIQIRAHSFPHDGAGSERETSPGSPLALSARDSSVIAAGLPADAFLRASEIAGRRLDARLVVLSACESALGRAMFAEGVLGLPSSFLSAGCRCVVASLWEVDDRTTAALMKWFYRGLESGLTVAGALRAAQLAVREDEPDPFHWAGFVVIGDGDVTLALEPRRSRERRAVFALAGVLLAASIPWVVWRRRSRRGRIAA